MQPLRILRRRVEAGPALDTAVCRALLDGVARHNAEDSLRIWRPDEALAFSGTDRQRAGFARAVERARAAGFTPFLRLAGGHAAVYSAGTVAFAWTQRVDDVRSGIDARFEDLAGRVAAALRQLGVDARVGAVPGEYCSGDYSMNASGRVKLMGVGQRLIRGAAHLGGVIVAEGGDAIRGVLSEAYEALELEFEPGTVGCVADEQPGVGWRDVASALLDQFQADHDLVEDDFDSDLLARAAAIAPRHCIDGPRYADAASMESDPKFVAEHGARRH